MPKSSSLFENILFMVSDINNNNNTGNNNNNNNIDNDSYYYYTKQSIEFCQS